MEGSLVSSSTATWKQHGDHASPSVELQTSATGVATAEGRLQDVDHQQEMDHDVIDLDSIQSVAALREMTASQIQELLADNFAGVVGGREDLAALLRRATLLWQDHTRYRTELSTLRGDQLCQVCGCDPIECVVMDCSHLGMCTACAREAKLFDQCPFCYGPVSEVRRVFRVPVFTGGIDAPAGGIDAPHPAGGIDAPLPPAAAVGAADKTEDHNTCS